MRTIMTVAAALSALGCASRETRETPAHHGPRGGGLAIELLSFPGCHNRSEMRDSLTAALKSIGGGLSFREVDQSALRESDPRRGWPSPTVLVNGRDLFGMPPPSSPSMTCRTYADGVPDADSIGKRLRAAGAP